MWVLFFFLLIVWVVRVDQSRMYPDGEPFNGRPMSDGDMLFILLILVVLVLALFSTVF